MLNRHKYAHILSILCLAALAAITVIASPLGIVNTYFPVVVFTGTSPYPILQWVIADH